jgi:FAD/FMN-containing dehydrogenase
VGGSARLGPVVSQSVRIGRDDPRWDTMRRGFNRRWVGNPDCVEVCADTAQVVDAVQRAYDAGKRITVRSGSHCYEDFVCDNEDGVIVDVAPMTGVYRDPANGLYCVEGGGTNWDVYWRLYKEFGVTLPAGSCYSVGAGGHFTGGGYGLLSRRDGLTVDYLHAVEVVRVNADGRAEAITVTRDADDRDERDMLWAHLGGGGGNFGIVTRFWFRDPPRAPNEAWVLNHAWSWQDLEYAQFRRLVENYGGFLEANSEVGSPYAGVFGLLHLTQNAGPGSQIVLSAQYVGDEPQRLEEFARAVEDGVQSPAPQLEPVGYHHLIAQDTDIQAMPWLFATQLFNGSGPNRRGKYKSAYLTQAFPGDQIDAMWGCLAAPTFPNSSAVVQVDSYGCQVNAVASDASAIPQRSSVMKLQFQIYWTDPAQDDDNLAWIRQIYGAMYGDRGPYPDGVVDGCYVNYPDVDLEDWQYLYYKDNYPRLRRAKKLWDPHEVFHHKQSIEPAP